MINNCMHAWREYRRHMMKIIIDMDDLTYGLPTLRFWPKPPLTLIGKPIHYVSFIKKNGRLIRMAEIQAS